MQMQDAITAGVFDYVSSTVTALLNYLIPVAQTVAPA